MASRERTHSHLSYENLRSRAQDFQGCFFLAFSMSGILALIVIFLIGGHYGHIFPLQYERCPSEFDLGSTKEAFSMFLRMAEEGNYGANYAKDHEISFNSSGFPSSLHGKTALVQTRIHVRISRPTNILAEPLSKKSQGEINEEGNSTLGEITWKGLLEQSKI